MSIKLSNFERHKTWYCEEDMLSLGQISVPRSIESYLRNRAADYKSQGNLLLTITNMSRCEWKGVQQKKNAKTTTTEERDCHKTFEQTMDFHL